LAIVMGCCIKDPNRGFHVLTQADQIALATEMMNSLTEGAHKRVTSLIMGVPYER
jgi:hypothetical protein